MSYWRLYYHLVWATAAREPMIDEHRAVLIERVIRSECRQISAAVHAFFAVPDHVHVALSIPPRHAISSIVQKLKGNSSHLLNHGGRRPGDDWFSWQNHYGIISISENRLERVVRYVEHQREHHASGTVSSKLEQVLSPRIE